MNKTKFKQTVIGIIPEDWEVFKGEDCLILEIGSRPKGGVSDVGEIPSLGGEHIDLVSHRIDFQKSPKYISREYFNQMQKGKLKINDILINKDGAYTGKLAFVWELFFPETVINEHLFIIRSNSRLDQKFIFYYLLSNEGEHQIKQNVTGSAQAGLNSQFIKRIMLPKPSLSEQIQISEILSRLDLKINIIQKQNKTLEAIAQVIFTHWFIDFEFPNENGEPYKSSGGEMMDSELGAIPKGWNIRSLNKIANFLNGLAMQKYRPENNSNYFPVLKIKELKIGGTSENSDKCSVNIDPKYIVDDGDVVFSWSGSLEVRLWCGNKAGLNQHLFKVTSANYPKWFYFYWIKYHIEDFRRIAEDKTTTMGHIKQEHLRKAKVLDPGKNYFEKFNKVINGLIELFINNEKEIKYLSQLRDTLLPKLMSGEIRVPINNKNYNQLK